MLNPAERLIAEIWHHALAAWTREGSSQIDISLPVFDAEARLQPWHDAIGAAVREYIAGDLPWIKAKYAGMPVTPNVLQAFQQDLIDVELRKRQEGPANELWQCIARAIGVNPAAIDMLRQAGEASAAARMVAKPH